MLRAMDSAVAGLRAHQNKMDVVGHNLANVNTFGFKAQTYSFKEAMYQTSAASTGGSESAGGSNAAQFGYGTLMGTIGMDMTASTPSQVSGLNACINGEGFFVTCATKGAVSNLTSNPAADGTASFKGQRDWDYTRVGQFLIDSKGYLVDGNNNFVYGFLPDATKDNGFDTENLVPLRVPTAIDADGKATYSNTATGGVFDGKEPAALLATSVEINKLGEITATVTAKDTSTPPKETTYPGISLGKVAIVTFQNPNGLTKGGGSYYKATDSDNTGAVEVKIAGGDVAELMPGYIEASNVDLAKEFADMITTHRGFQANSKMITVSDEMLSDLVSMKR